MTDDNGAIDSATSREEETEARGSLPLCALLEALAAVCSLLFSRDTSHGQHVNDDDNSRNKRTMPPQHNGTGKRAHVVRHRSNPTTVSMEIEPEVQFDDTNATSMDIDKDAQYNHPRMLCSPSLQARQHNIKDTEMVKSKASLRHESRTESKSTPGSRATDIVQHDINTLSSSFFDTNHNTSNSAVGQDLWGAKVTPNMKFSSRIQDEVDKTNATPTAKKALFSSGRAPRPLKSDSVVPRHDPFNSVPKRHASFSPSKTAFIYVSRDEIMDDDILFDRKDIGKKHPGTMHFGNLIKESRPTYEACGNDFDKKALIFGIVNNLSQGGRFIRRIGDGPYFLLTEEDAREIVSEALRDRRTSPPSCSSELPVLTMPSSIGTNGVNTVTPGTSRRRQRRRNRRRLPITRRPPPVLFESVPTSNSGQNDATGTTNATSDINRPRKNCFSPSKIDRISILKNNITDNDVLCGREFRETSHPGNKSYLLLVESKKSYHRSLGCKHGEKTKIRNEIVDEVVNRGGRFVKKQGARYYLMTLEEARTKVGQALRDKKSK